MLPSGCYLPQVAFVWELTKETIHLPLGCLQGGEQLSCLVERGERGSGRGGRTALCAAQDELRQRIGEQGAIAIAGWVDRTARAGIRGTTEKRDSCNDDENAAHHVQPPPCLGRGIVEVAAPVHQGLAHILCIRESHLTSRPSYILKKKGFCF